MKNALLILTVVLSSYLPGCGQTGAGRDEAASANPQPKAMPENASGGGTVKHYGGMIKVRPEYEERYVIIHRHVWPEVLDRIVKSNIRNYTIFMHGGCLYSHYDYTGADYQGDMAAIAADPVTRDWWKLTDPMQEPLESRKEGDWWAALDVLLDDTAKQVPSSQAERHAYLARLKPGCDQAVREAFASLAKSYSGQAVRNANIQNFVFYLHERNLVLYLEYCGKDYAADRERFLQNEKWLGLEKALAPCLEQPDSLSVNRMWVEMEDVFHTD